MEVADQFSDLMLFSALQVPRSGNWMRFVFLLIAFAGSLLLAAPAVASSLSGHAEWRWADYRADREEAETIQASHFTQQYSLLYENKGLFQNGRGGSYDLNLGYEWTAVDSEVRGNEIDLSTGKVLYRGELLIAPGGLPFRLHLFSYDDHRTMLNYDSIQGQTTLGLLRPEIVTDLANGQHITSGATLLIGIKNGSYLGNYRDILSQFPRLLMDYRENYVRDLKGNAPQHYRLRNLAFVSLNKKDNWFHYRITDFEDFENHLNDYTETGYILGTIDHDLRRHWINLTNWIQVSANGSYTTTKRVGIDGPPQERYDLNLFTKTRYNNWAASNFNTFSRILDGGSLEKTIEIPFFLSGEFDRNTSWRFRFDGSSEWTERVDEDFRQEKENLYAATRIETFRQGRYILAPELEVERKQGDFGDGYGVRAGLEFFSNRRYQPTYDLFGAYSVTHLAGTGTKDTDVDYWEQQLDAEIATNLTARLRTGIKERMIYGSGTMDRSVTEHIAPGRGNGLLSGDTDQGTTFESSTTWFAEHRGIIPLNNRIQIVYDFLSSEEQTADALTVDHHLNYDRRALRVTMKNSLIFDGSQANTGFNSEFDTAAAAAKKSFIHSGSVSYLPGRAWEANAKVDYGWRDSESGATSQWRIRQDYQYRFFSINGIVRRLVDLGEEVDYERFHNIDGELRTSHTFTLTGNYYPTKRTLLGAKFRYRTITPEETDERTYFLTAGLNFAELQISLEYDYSTANSESEERRWEVKLRKIF